MKLPDGPNSSTWSSLADRNAWIATMLSPPGLFSITTGWPHFCVSFSANSRPPMSAPAPGPNGTMNFTGRVGQFCACAGVTSGVARTARWRRQRKSFNERHGRFLRL